MSMPLGRFFTDADRARVNRAVDEAARKVEERQHAIENLTAMQKIALLKMNPSTLSRGVAAKLIAEEAFDEHPCYGDYLSLAKLGLCERPADGQYHEITALGEIDDFGEIIVFCESPEAPGGTCEYNAVGLDPTLCKHCGKRTG